MEGRYNKLHEIKKKIVNFSRFALEGKQTLAPHTKFSHIFQRICMNFSGTLYSNFDIFYHNLKSLVSLTVYLYRFLIFGWPQAPSDEENCKIYYIWQIQGLWQSWVTYANIQPGSIKAIGPEYSIKSKEMCDVPDQFGKGWFGSWATSFSKGNRDKSQKLRKNKSYKKYVMSNIPWIINLHKPTDPIV